jgi:hypothetical protein
VITITQTYVEIQVELLSATSHEIRPLSLPSWVCIYLSIPLLRHRKWNKHPPSSTYLLRHLHGFHRCRFLHLLQKQSGNFQILKTKVTFKVPPYTLILVCLSRRIHSIFVLRLFNDTIAMLFLYIAIAFFISRRWSLGCFVFRYFLVFCIK